MTGMRVKRSAPVTPDGRYIDVRGRLWRRSDPGLTSEDRQVLVDALVAAGGAVREVLASGDASVQADARGRVDAAKIGLGERGPVWWRDGAPDVNQHMARTTVYAAWFASLGDRAAN